jgi:hypothetical protein
MTITDAKELASNHLPVLRRLFNKIEHIAASPVEQPATAPLDERTALTLLRRAHKALACAALTKIPNGERLWDEIGDYLTNCSESSSAEATVDTLIARPDPLNREPSEYASDMLKRAAADSIRRENASAPAHWRMAFEAYMTRKGYVCKTHMGGYVSGDVAAKWDLWQAASAASANETADGLVTTGLGWRVREHRAPDGTLLDCFVEAPPEGDMPYGLQVLGDDYTGYGDLARKYEHCKMIVAWANRASSPNETGAEGAPRYAEWLHLRAHGEWSNGVPEWARDYSGRMNDFTAATAVIEELAALASRAPAQAAEPVVIPIGYICADDLKQLAEGNGAIVSPRCRETDVPVFARAPAQAAAPVAHILPSDLEALQTYSKQCQVVLYREPRKTRVALYTAPQPTAQADARDGLTDEQIIEFATRRVPPREVPKIPELAFSRSQFVDVVRTILKGAKQ